MKNNHLKQIFVLLIFFLNINFNIHSKENKRQETKINQKNEKENTLIENLYEDIKNNSSIEITDKTKENENEEKPEAEQNSIKKPKFKLKLGGLFDFQYGYNKFNQNFRTGELNPNQLTYQPQFGNGNGLYSTFGDMNIRTKIDISPEFQIMSLKIGAFIAIPIVKNYDSDPKTASQEYLYLDTKFIRIELGSVFSAASKMRVDPQNIASGTGGAYGDWWRYSSFSIYNTVGMNSSDANALNSSFSPIFMIYPTLPNEAGFTAGNSIGQPIFNGNGQTNAYVSSVYLKQGIPSQGARSNKISFFTKRLGGIQFGMSYSPNTLNTGFMNNLSTVMSGTIGGGVKNYLSFAINYKKQFQEFGIAISVSYETGEANAMYSIFNNSNGTQNSTLLNNGYIARNNLNAFAVGVQVNYKNLAISYAYNDWLDSLLPKAGYSIPNTGGYYAVGTGVMRSFSHVVGISLNYGPLNFSTQYMHSFYSGNTTDLISIGTDFKITSLKYLMVVPYLEYNYVILSPHSVNINASGNTYQAITMKGSVFIAGIRMIF